MSWLSTKYSQTKIHQFILGYVKAKNAELAEQSDDIFTIKYPKEPNPIAYTYEPAVARDNKAQLLTLGSPAFQQILKECQAQGALCQIILQPKNKLEELMKNHFNVAPFTSEECESSDSKESAQNPYAKNQPSHHIVNNAKIVSIKKLKEEQIRYSLFYYSATFQNKLRPKNEELITIILDEEGNDVSDEAFRYDEIFANADFDIVNSKNRFATDIFNKLKSSADERLDIILKEKLILFDVPLNNPKRSKLISFEKRLKRIFHEQITSKNQDFADDNWRANYESLMQREEESLLTSLTVKFLNLLIVNTVKIKCELKLDNKSVIQASIKLGTNYAPEVTCPICRKSFNEGYATKDSLYVCKECIRQSIDTRKIYSTKAPMRLDETLNEYIEADSGFICSVCGKKHSRLLEFKCSYDNSSVCVYHYELCDVCGKVFSKLNLSHTDEFKQLLCPEHAAKHK